MSLLFGFASFFCTENYAQMPHEFQKNRLNYTKLTADADDDDDGGATPSNASQTTVITS